MAFTYVTVSRNYDITDGTDPSGYLTFTPTVPMVNSGVTVAAVPVRANLDVDGLVSIDLAASNDPDTLPTTAAYLVIERIVGQPIRQYYVVIPYDIGSVDLGELDTLDAVPPKAQALAQHIADTDPHPGLGLTLEEIRDTIGTTLVAGPGVGIDVDDAGNEVTIRALVFSGDPTGGADVSATLVTEATTAAAAGLPLIVPPGDYLCGSTATLPDDLTVWAPSGARLFGEVAAGGLISVGAGTTITGLTLENISEPDGCAAVIQQDAVDVLIDKCTIIAPSIGIHANESGIKNLTVRGGHIRDTYFGILTNTGANDIQGVHVDGVHFSGVLGDAIEFNHPSGSAPTCRGFRVENCYIEGVGGEGGTVSTGFGIGVAGCSEVTITGNTIRAVLREGIHVEDGSRNVTITGNTVRDIPDSGTNRGAIVVYGAGTDDVVINGNTVTDINGIGIELVYSGGVDLVSHVAITNNVIRSMTSHGIFAGADGDAGDRWVVANNIVHDCDEYGIALVGTFDLAGIHGNVITNCDVGIGCGQFGQLRLVRDNLIAHCATTDIDGFDQGVHLNSRVAKVTATATTTTLAVPLLRLGNRAEGSIAIALYSDTGPRWIDSLWRVRWDGTALLCGRVDGDNNTSDDDNLSMVDGVLTADLTGVADGVVMAGSVTFSGLCSENSQSFSGTVVGTALDDDAFMPLSGGTFTGDVIASADLAMEGNTGSRFFVKTNSDAAHMVTFDAVLDGVRVSGWKGVGISQVDGNHDIAIRPYSGNPEGNIGGSPGDLCPSTSGALYIKVTGTGPTGWAAVTHA